MKTSAAARSRKSAKAARSRSSAKATATAATVDAATFEAWQSSVFHNPTLQNAGKVLVQQPARGGVVLVVDGPLRFTHTKGARGPLVRTMSVHNIRTGTVQPVFRVPPRAFVGTRLSGPFAYRLPKDVSTLEAAAVIPDSYTLAPSPAPVTKDFARRLLASYHVAMGERTPKKPQANAGLVEQLREWLVTVQDAIDTSDAGGAPGASGVRIRFVRVANKPRPDRPQNTRRMIPFAVAHKALGAYYVRVRQRTPQRTPHVRQQNELVYHRVAANDAAYAKGYLAFNVRSDGTAADEPGYVSHVGPIDHDYMSTIPEQ